MLTLDTALGRMDRKELRELRDSVEAYIKSGGEVFVFEAPYSEEPVSLFAHSDKGLPVVDPYRVRFQEWAGPLKKKIEQLLLKVPK